MDKTPETPDVKPAADATSIWDDRYEKGEHVGSQAVIESDPTDYTQHKFLYQHSIGKPMTGSLDGWSVDSIAREFFNPPPARVLAIGSGMAFVEEYLVAQGYAQHVTVYEMSQVAVDKARERVTEKPYAGKLDLRCGDVLTADIPDGEYDAVFVLAAIHHFSEIEAMYAFMHRVLKPGGLLWFDEYIGPDHHIYEPEVLAIMDEVNDCLAPSYRFDVLWNQTRTQVPRPSLEWMLQHDPSEGVHASRILPLTYQWFDVIHRQDYGGAIMRPFFTAILPNFDWANPRDQTVARLVILIEQMLTRQGVLPNYHTSIVGRRREQPLPPLTAEEEHRINYADWPGLIAKAAPKPAPAGLLARLLGR